jgi:hypothetical protein
MGRSTDKLDFTSSGSRGGGCPGPPAQLWLGPRLSGKCGSRSSASHTAHLAGWAGWLSAPSTWRETCVMPAAMNRHCPAPSSAHISYLPSHRLPSPALPRPRERANTRRGRVGGLAPTAGAAPQRAGVPFQQPLRSSRYSLSYQAPVRHLLAHHRRHRVARVHADPGGPG